MPIPQNRGNCLKYSGPSWFILGFEILLLYFVGEKQNKRANIYLLTKNEGGISF